MAKRTPAARRASSADYTINWLKHRQQAWDDHETTLLQSRAKRQQTADEITRRRQQDWSDYHADEAARTARRDGYPSPLDQAKEHREQQQQLAAQQTDAYRQQAAEELSHPPHLRQAEKFNWRHGWVWIGAGNVPGSRENAAHIRSMVSTVHEMSGAAPHLHAAADAIDQGQLDTAARHLRTAAAVHVATLGTHGEHDASSMEQTADVLSRSQLPAEEARMLAEESIYGS